MAWHQPDFPYRKRYTIDHTEILGPITDLPVPVPVSDDIAAHAQEDYRDLRFTDAAGTGLDYQLETGSGTEVMPDAAACWYNLPRAVSYSDTHSRTYLSGVSKTGDILVGHLDHDTLDTTRFVLKAGPLDRDDHDAPGLLIRPDGKIVAFYSEHSVANTAMWTRVSTSAEDASAWDAETTVLAANVSYGYAYPKPVYLASEDRYYVFYRTGISLDQAFIYSDDDMATWSAPKVLLSNRGGPGVQRPYVVLADNGDDRIDLVFTDGHPRELPGGTSIYHAYITGGDIFESDGTSRGTITSLGATGLDAGSFNKIFDGTTAVGKAWNWDLRRDNETGVITAALAVFPPATPDSSVHHYYRAQWTPSGGWTVVKVIEAGSWIPVDDATVEPQYGGGVTVDPYDHDSLIASIQTGDEAFNFVRCRTRDHGLTWPVTAVTQGNQSQTKRIRPICPTPINAIVTPGPEFIGDEGRFTTFTSYDLRKLAFGGPFTPQPTTARVRLPTISDTTDTVFYAYYGNPTADAAQASPYDAHTFQHYDLTGMLLDGTRYQTWDSMLTAGVPLAGLSALTVEVDMACTSDSGDGQADYLFSNWNGLNNAATFLLRIKTGTSNPEAFVVIEPDTVIGGPFDVGGILRDGDPHSLAVEFDAVNGIDLWCDGIKAARGTSSAPSVGYAGGANLDVDNSNFSVRLGATPHVTSPTRYFEGTITRAAISNITRGDSWHAAVARAGTDLLDAGGEERLTFQFDDELNAQLIPWRTPSLTTYANALGGMFQPVSDLVYDQGEDGDPGFVPGWGVLLDPDLCPVPYLPYLAQFVGVSIPAGTSSDAARQLIRDEAGINRGTLASIRSAVLRNLTGTKFCVIQERLRVDGTPDAYQMVVVVHAGEIATSAAAITAAVDTVRPAGILVNLVQSDGFTWSSAIHTWADEGTWDSLAATQP